MSGKGSKVERLKKAVRTGKALKHAVVIALPVVNALCLFVLNRLMRDEK